MYSVKESGTFLAFMADAIHPFVMILGTIRKKDKEIFPINVKLQERDEKRYSVLVECEKLCDVVEFEINMYVKKMIFDTTIEEFNPDRNNAYGGVAFLDNSKENGRQWLYSRLDGALLEDLSVYKLESAKLYLKNYKILESALAAYRLELPWCSLGMTWNSKVTYSKFSEKIYNSAKYTVIDITEEVKELLNDYTIRNTGVVVCGGTATTVVATGDSCFYPPIIEIKLKEN